MARNIFFVRCLALVTALGIAGVAVAQDSARPSLREAKETLEADGLKVSTAGIVLPDEADFAKMLKDVLVLKKALITAEKELQTHEMQLDTIKRTITALKAQHVEMSAALAAGIRSINEHNRVVGALNATSGQIDLLIQQQEAVTDNVKKARGKVSEAREAFVEHVLNMRTSADKVAQQWDKLAADPKNQQAIAAINEGLNKNWALKPSTAFTAGLRQLQGLEEKVLLETIPLRNERNSLWVNVVINGKTKEMVVDSGATSISLPFALAKELGLEPNSSDEKIIVGLADGSRVPATRKTISTVRVGKFQVDNVECVVLGPEAVEAPPLLGMSFLGHFQFELNSSKSELKMVKVEGDSKRN